MSDYSARILADGAVAYWRLGEASGVTAADAGPNANTGVYTGSVTLGVAGAVVGDSNTAASLPGGTANYVTVPDANSLDLGDGPFTLECWVKRAALGAAHGLISKATNYRLTINSTNQLRLGQGGTLIVLSGATTIGTSWTHCVATRSAAGAATKLYINGVDVTGTVTTVTLASNANALLLGCETVGASSLNGVLDEVALYNVALTPTQVQEHYQLGTSSFPPVGTVTATGKASTVTVAVSPPAGTGTVTGQTPTAQVATQPSVGTVSAQGAAPTPGVAVTPPAGGLTAQGLVPTVSISATVSVDPGTATVSGLGPSPGVTQDASSAAITVSGLGAGLSREVTPSSGDVTVQGQAPSSSVSVESDAGALTATGESPSVAGQVEVDAGQIVAQGLDPTLVVAGTVSVDVDTAAVVVQGLAPTVSVTGQQVPTAVFGGRLAERRRRDASVEARTAHVWIDGLRPSVDVSDSPASKPKPLPDFVEVETVREDVLVAVSRASISAQPHAPQVSTSAEVAPDVGRLIFAALDPEATVHVFHTETLEPDREQEDEELLLLLT